MEFSYYCTKFNSVELNNPFYRVPEDSVLVNWKLRAEEAFEYTVKANQYFSHQKRLNVDDAFVSKWQHFWQKCQLLRPYVGPVLFQFPPNFELTKAGASPTWERIQRLTAVLPMGEKFAFEFRHPSWFCEEVTFFFIGFSFGDNGLRGYKVFLKRYGGIEQYCVSI